MDLMSVTLVAGADFGGVVARHLTASEFELVFDSDSGIIGAIHRRTRKMRLIHVASGIVLEPDPSALPAAFRPRQEVPPAKPINGANGRGASSRPAR